MNIIPTKQYWMQISFSFISSGWLILCNFPWYTTFSMCITCCFGKNLPQLVQICCRRWHRDTAFSHVCILSPGGSVKFKIWKIVGNGPHSHFLEISILEKETDPTFSIFRKFGRGSMYCNYVLGTVLYCIPLFFSVLYCTVLCCN